MTDPSSDLPKVDVVDYAAPSSEAKEPVGWLRACVWGLAVGCVLVLCWTLTLYWLKPDRFGISELKRSVLTVTIIVATGLLLRVSGRAGCVTMFLMFAVAALAALWIV